MENVTDEVSNPFGMRPPCPHSCAGDHRAVFGYGDANADFHVIGDHPGVHGGSETGIPFTGTETGERVLDLLEATDYLEERDPVPELSNCFLSYLYLCCVPEGGEPTDAEYRDFEPFFDAELRAIAADVLLPVGRRVTEYVIAEHTARGHKLDPDVEDLHGRRIHGRGFLVMPIADPGEWGEEGFERVVEALTDLRESGYHQMVDLGRFLPGGDPYFVR